MKTSNIIRNAARALAVGALALATAHAQTVWQGDTDSQWGNAANWSSGVPTSSVVAQFDDTALFFSGITPGDGAFVRNAQRLVFSNNSNNYTFTFGTGSFTDGDGNSITGNRLNLGVASGLPSLDKTGAGTVTIPFALAIGGNRDFSVAAGAGDVFVNQIVGTTATDYSVAKVGGGTLEFYSRSGTSANTNNFGVGNVFVNEGLLRLNKFAGFRNYGATLSVGSNDGSGSAGGAQVTTLQNNQLSGNGLTIYNEGRLNIGTTTQNFTGSQLRMFGGDIFFDAGGVLNLGTSTTNITNISAVNTRQTRISAASTGTLNLGAATTTIAVDNTVSGSDMRIDAVVAGAGNVIKTDDGILLYGGSQSNTLTGTTTVEDGSLQLGKTGGAVGLAGDVVVQSTATTIGSLLLTGGAGQLAASIDVTLQGGNFDIRADETVNSLTLLAGGAAQPISVLNFNTSSPVNFTISTAATYTSGGLSILNWNGSLTGGGTDQFLFNFDPTAFVTALGSNISFDGYGTGANVIDRGGGLFEVVAVPEPSSFALAAFAVGFAAVASRRRARHPQA